MLEEEDAGERWIVVGVSKLICTNASEMSVGSYMVPDSAISLPNVRSWLIEVEVDMDRMSSTYGEYI
jgi:hypothetical protein